MYTKKSFTRMKSLGMGAVFVASFSLWSNKAAANDAAYEAADTYSSSTGVPTYTPAPPVVYKPEPIYVPKAPPSSSVPVYNRNGSAEEAAMLTACGMERRPYGSPFVSGRTASNWRWSEVRNDPRREIEFSQRKHGNSAYENPLCEMYILKRMLEQGGVSSLKFRCELIRDDLYREHRNVQSGRSSAADFSLLDKFMGASSSSNSERVCRNPSSNDTYACATVDITNNLGNTSLQKQAAQKVLDLCLSRGADMRARVSYANAGLDPYGAGFCGYRGGMVYVQQKEPWYKTVANFTLGALNTLGPLYVLKEGHKMREKTSQMAIQANKDLGFPSVVTGNGSCGYGGYGCSGGGMWGGSLYGGGALGIGGAYPGWGGAGGYYPGFGGGHFGGGVPGPWGTAGGGNGWGGPWGTGGGAYNPWGPNGAYGGAPHWGSNGANGMYGASNGFYMDSWQAQQARSANNANRYSRLYDLLGQDARQNSTNMRGTEQGYFRELHQSGYYNTNPYMWNPPYR